MFDVFCTWTHQDVSKQPQTNNIYNTHWLFKNYKYIQLISFFANTYKYLTLSYKDAISSCLSTCEVWAVALFLYLVQGD